MSTSDRVMRVLVVDDDDNARALAVALIASSTVQVDQACTAEHALTMLDGQSYDLLISDVMMMRMDGIELAKRVRRDELHLDMPIVLITALADRETRIRCLEVADALLVKPLDRDELRLQLGALLKARARILALRQQANRQPG